MTDELPSQVVAAIAFVGRRSGTVKTLSGFKKAHHTLPDAANATTNAFLGKICAGELGAEAEQLFQAARTALGYKRKDITLALMAPTAVLTAKDFTVEIAYALEPAEPTRYEVTTALRELKRAELARTPEFTALFAGWFSEIAFALSRGASVEAVIDAIESLEGEGGLAVSYPSDCRECEISVTDVDATVRCTGASLDLVFARAGSPGELIDGFAAVREAFAISKTLAGLIG
jgi:hypothetical protein